jgi:hypothetical protein
LSILQFETSQNLFAQRVAIILNDFFLLKKKSLLDEFENILSNLSVDIIFVESKKIDSRLSMYKQLEKLSNKKEAIIQEAKNYNKVQLRNWLSKLVQGFGLKTENDSVLDYCIEVCGKDQFFLTSELAKLSVLDNIVINNEIVDKYLVASEESDIFRLLEKVLNIHSDEYLRYITELEEPSTINILVSILGKELSNVIKYKYLNINFSEAVKILSLNPFAFRFQLERYKNASLQNLVELFRKFINLERDLKIGSINTRMFIELLRASYI